MGRRTLRTGLRTKTVAGARRSLAHAVRLPKVRRTAQRAIAEFDRALQTAKRNEVLAEERSGIYGASYFGFDRDPLDRMGLSGYERYDRDTSNANVAAYLVWRHFPVEHTLDVGCAAGYVVEALCELGIDARGTDISQYAVEHPANGAVGRLQWGDLMAGLSYGDGEFDLVTCLETLEHLRPETIAAALEELRRITSGYLVATIPSFGPNPFGPGGWFEVKVRDDKTPQYYEKGPHYQGPIPHDDLYRDANGEPIEGHLTVASFSWWTEQFERAGFVRCGDTELRMHPDLARFGLTKYWNLYVFRVSETVEPPGNIRSPDELIHWEHNFGLAGKTGLPEDWDAVNDALARNRR